MSTSTGIKPEACFRFVQVQNRERAKKRRFQQKTKLPGVLVMINSDQNVFGFGAIYASINGYKRAAQVFHWNHIGSSLATFGIRVVAMAQGLRRR